MSSKLFMKIVYFVEEDRYEVSSDIKEERRKDMLGEVVRTHVGAGEDPNEANQQDIYEIRCSIDLSDDSIITESDCGNKGLETGILMQLLQRMNEDGTINQEGKKDGDD